MAQVVFTDTESWYAGLATMSAAAAAIITDEAGRLLLVKPNYRDHWSLPGGILEHGEPPHVGCAREVAEETGLKITVGPLLVVDWLAPGGDRPRAFLYFLFDGGTLAPGTEIVLQQEELDDYRFTEEAEFGSYLPPFLVTRYSAALRARATGKTIYLPAQPAD